MAAIFPRGAILSKKSGTITTDGSGDATGAISFLNGQIMGVYVNLITSTGATVTVTTSLGDKILDAVAVTADTFYPIRDTPIENDGATAYTNSCIEYINTGADIDIIVASGGDTKTLEVKIYYI